MKARTKQLADLNEEFEARNAELERFTYTVSHDLSSPLITIKTFVGFVEQELAWLMEPPDHAPRKRPMILKMIYIPPTSIWPPLVKKKLLRWIGKVEKSNATSSVSRFRFLNKQFAGSDLRFQSRASARLDNASAPNIYRD